MKKINIVLPIAGKAQRFLDEGYLVPKPLIIVDEKHIIDWALESLNLGSMEPYQLIFVVRLDHINNFAIDEILKKKFGNDIKIVVVDHITEGSVCTCLLAKDLISNEDELLIYTPDVHFGDPFTLNKIKADEDGHILTFKANSPAHSYAQLDKDGYVTKTVEKEVISENAAVGVYYFKTGRMFVKYANKLIEEDIRTNNEFYLCPIYNLMVADGLKVKTSQVQKMHVLGTPSELEFFKLYVAPRFGKKPIALCADHSGFELKEQAKEVLKRFGLKYIDFGCYVDKDCDYIDYVTPAINEINHDVDFVLGFCRTGQGVNILANKSNKVRAALVFDEYTAEYSVRHNCGNFFSIPSKYVDSERLSKIIGKLLTNRFDGGRHMTRMNKTIAYDK
jgi:RpiB/LacA/LacB family sugar-phosphate isomerase